MSASFNVGFRSTVSHIWYNIYTHQTLSLLRTEWTFLAFRCFHKVSVFSASFAFSLKRMPSFLVKWHCLICDQHALYTICTCKQHILRVYCFLQHCVLNFKIAGVVSYSYPSFRLFSISTATVRYLNCRFISDMKTNTDAR